MPGNQEMHHSDGDHCGLYHHPDPDQHAREARSESEAPPAGDVDNLPSWRQEAVSGPTKRSTDTTAHNTRQFLLGRERSAECQGVRISRSHRPARTSAGGAERAPDVERRRVVRHLQDAWAMCLQRGGGGRVSTAWTAAPAGTGCNSAAARRGEGGHRIVAPRMTPVPLLAEKRGLCNGRGDAPPIGGRGSGRARPRSRDAHVLARKGGSGHIEIDAPGLASSMWGEGRSTARSMATGHVRGAAEGPSRPTGLLWGGLCPGRHETQASEPGAAVPDDLPHDPQVPPRQARSGRQAARRTRPPVSRSVGLERVTPRPDSTDTCGRCHGHRVFDEVHGWLHTDSRCLLGPLPSVGNGDRSDEPLLDAVEAILTWSDDVRFPG